MRRPLGAIGTSADNAAYASFHASLKRETLRRPDGLREAVFRWITRYNTRRRHSSNRYLNPADNEASRNPSLAT
ncbi:integrase core domain-containing protein [Streptomyces sp. NBC_00063]|uniref:integrase core domain-containing protein n=1 Tax=Streptomyces sp. NBC_00063 TaxID=2975638 RepID=UPI003D745ADA